MTWLNWQVSSEGGFMAFFFPAQRGKLLHWMKMLKMKIHLQRWIPVGILLVMHLRMYMSVYTVRANTVQ